MRTCIVTAFAICLAGCGAAKPEAIEDFSDLSALDEKSDAFSYRMRVLGSLGYGETSSQVKYTSSPRFRAFKIAGKKGDALDAWVRSSDGDAVAWLLDGRFNVVTSNDDADATTFDSHLTATLGKTGTFYLVFREYALDRATFMVSLGALGCDYNGTHHDVGAGFPSTDGCNTCSCTATGSVACTKRFCVAGCNYNGTHYAPGASFPSSDACNTCSCNADGNVFCTERFCVPTDCRTSGCDTGKHCDICRTLNGPAYVCLPDGAVC